jgi:threonine synthase
MKLYSTLNKDITANFKEAVIKGIPPGGGLYMPSHFPKLRDDFYKSHRDSSLPEMAFEICKTLVGDEISDAHLKSIIFDNLTFDAPLEELEKNKFILELFHGPTLAFKDFGAKFMAGALSYFTKNSNRETIILVATSGDTGSAVANGFLGKEGIKVVLLYPSGKVSKIQEQQLTTIGGNVIALEIDGTFDDCQRLVKEAFSDVELNSLLTLSSANSINIARLIPQSFYYHYAYSKLADRGLPVVFSVPSGNLGNITAGLFAKEMGLPVTKFIAAVNANNIVPEYLRTSVFTPKPSVATVSNAMDVGNPSNFQRISELFNKDYSSIKKLIYSKSYSDTETLKGIKEVLDLYDYTIDPHGAVGYLALKDFLNEQNESFVSVILETAHPAKFYDTVTSAIGKDIKIPAGLATALNKTKYSIKMVADYNHFRDFLKKFE